MPKLDPSLGQHLADEQPPMAALRISLAAEQSDPVAPHACDKTVDGRCERLVLGHQAI